MNDTQRIYLNSTPRYPIETSIVLGSRIEVRITPSLARGVPATEIILQFADMPTLALFLGQVSDLARTIGLP